MPKALALTFAFLACLPGRVFAASSCGWELRVVGFHSKQVKLQVDDQTVRLSSGSWGYSIPPGSDTRFLKGDALMLLDTMRITAHWGDRFSFFCNGDYAEIVVSEGSLSVQARRKGPQRELEAGEFLMVPPIIFPELEAVPIAKGPKESIVKLPLSFLVELHPYYQLQETYDNNIYRVPPDQANGNTVGGGVLSSWITTNNLGSTAKLLFSRTSSMEAAYDLKSLLYTTQPDANDALEHTASLSYIYENPRGLKSKIFDNYVNATTPPSSELAGRTRHFDNTLGVTAELPLARRFVFNFDASDTNYRFLDPGFAAFLDRYEQLFGMSAGILIQPRTKLYVAYHRDLVHYSAGRSDNSKSDLVDLGLEGRLGPKITGKIQAGAQLRGYDADPVLNAGNYVKTFQTDVQLSYKPDVRSRINFLVGRRLEESRLEGTRFYTSDFVGLSALRVYRRLTLGLDTRYERSAFSDPITDGNVTDTRRDNIYTAGANLGYTFRPWLIFNLSYTKTLRESNFGDLFNYKDDLTTLNIKAQF